MKVLVILAVMIVLGGCELMSIDEMKREVMQRGLMMVKRMADDSIFLRQTNNKANLITNKIST